MTTFLWILSGGLLMSVIALVGSTTLLLFNLLSGLGLLLALRVGLH